MLCRGATAPIDATVHDAIVSLRGQVWSRNERIAAMVMLHGTVPTWTARHRAESAARPVPGVRRVMKLLLIRD